MIQPPTTSVQLIYSMHLISKTDSGSSWPSGRRGMCGGEPSRRIAPAHAGRQWFGSKWDLSKLSLPHGWNVALLHLLQRTEMYGSEATAERGWCKTL